MNSLSKNSREIFLTSMEWGDQYWSPQAGLLGTSPYIESQPSPSFMVRESAWYALGLLLRDQSGDRDRAAAILRVVLKQQYHDPGKAWDGTFRVSPSSPDPGADAVSGRTFDPNWREFVGTTLAVILSEYPDRIPQDLIPPMLEAIDDAVSGEINQARLSPSYTNIALMYGYLWNFAALRGNRPEWVAPAEQWQESVYKLFKQHDAFSEYNSPTYYGVDLFGLALWRDYGFTPRMRSLGSEMEAAMWRSTASLYNANLRNISGPYDRSYGMDMQRYVSVTGLWLRTVLPADEAPLPTFTPPVDHVGDLWFVPLIVILDTRIPSDAMKSFRRFQGEHQVRLPIENDRIATAWIGKSLIYGGEITGQKRGVDSGSQFHAVTVQWQAPSAIGWIQLTRCPPIDAVADNKGIAITAKGDVSFRISAPAINASDATQQEWNLPGLTVRVAADAKSFTAVQSGSYVDVQYTGITNMMMTFVSSAANQRLTP